MFNEGDNRFKAPGPKEVEVEPGRYTLWRETSGIWEGRSFKNPEELPSDVEFVVIGPDNELLELQQGMNSTKSVNGAESKSVGYVEVEQAGTVTVQVLGAGAKGQVYSFSESLNAKMLLLLPLGILSAFLCFFLGLALTIWGIVKLVSKPTTPPALS